MFLNIFKPCRIMQYTLTLVRLSIFTNVYMILANNPCDRIAGIPFIDSILGWLLATFFWLALPCLFYTLVTALVPSNNKQDRNIEQNVLTVVKKRQSRIDSQSNLSSKHNSEGADVDTKGRADKLMTFFSHHLTSFIVLIVDIMGVVLKNYLVDLEVMGSEVLRIAKVETSSKVLMLNSENMLSKEQDSLCESSDRAELPWFKVLFCL